MRVSFFVAFVFVGCLSKVGHVGSLLVRSFIGQSLNLRGHLCPHNSSVTHLLLITPLYIHVWWPSRWSHNIRSLPKLRILLLIAMLLRICSYSVESGAKFRLRRHAHKSRDHARRPSPVRSAPRYAPNTVYAIKKSSSVLT